MIVSLSLCHRGLGQMRSEPTLGRHAAILRHPVASPVVIVVLACQIGGRAISRQHYWLPNALPNLASALDCPRCRPTRGTHIRVSFRLAARDLSDGATMFWIAGTATSGADTSIATSARDEGGTLLLRHLFFLIKSLSSQLL